MVGVPSGLGAVGGVLLAVGALIAVAVALLLVRRGPASSAPLGGLVALTLGVALGSVPVSVWRIVEDLRFTTSLDPVQARGAGPIQSYLPPYLLDRVPRLMPRGDTYYASASGVNRIARQAFPALALRALFPRISVDRPAEADWIVTLGVDPRRLASVGSVIVAREPFGVYPAVLVARVREQ